MLQEIFHSGMMREDWRMVAQAPWRLLWVVLRCEGRSALRLLTRGMVVWMRMRGQMKIGGVEPMFDVGIGRRSWLW